MSKQVEMLCTKTVDREGLYVSEGSVYPLYRDNYGEYFEDEKGNDHYLADLEWESSFNLV